LSTRGSEGRPSTRSPMILRWISSLPPAMRMAGAWQQQFLNAPAMRIAGGSDEIQRKIIGERVLGLPSEPRVDKDVPFRDQIHRRP